MTSPSIVVTVSSPPKTSAMPKSVTLRVPVRREHEVLGLHVAVQDALLVGELQRLARGEERGARRDEGEPLRGEPLHSVPPGSASMTRRQRPSSST